MIKVFAGTNSYLISDYIDKIKKDFTLENGEMSIEEIDCEEIEFSNIVNALSSTPLFSLKKLVIAKNIAKNKLLSEKVEQILKLAQNSDEFIIVEKEIDKRSAYYKFLKKNTDFIECDEPNEGQLIDWLNKKAESLEVEISRQDAKYLIERVGINQQLLANELSKLAAFDKTISRHNIDQLTSEKPISSIFNLLDAAFSGNKKSALNLYEEQKAQGAEPQSIFGMLVWQANVIATVAVGASMPPKELSESTGLKPFSISKANNIYKRFGPVGVKNFLNKLVEADMQIKTNSRDPDEVLKNLIVTIS